MTEKTYVVAGNHQEFLEHVKRKLQRLYSEGDTRLTISDFVYVVTVDQLRGRRDIKGYYYGSYMQRPDIAEIQNMIQIIKTRFGVTDTSTLIINSILVDEYATQFIKNSA